MTETDDRILGLLRTNGPMTVRHIMSLDSAPNSNEHPSIDHIIPLIRGGAHEWDNIRLVCRGCNESKGCRMPQEAEA